VVWDAPWGFLYGPGQSDHDDERAPFAGAQDRRPGANAGDAGTETGGAPRNGTAGEPATDGGSDSSRWPGLKTPHR